MPRRRTTPPRPPAAPPADAEAGAEAMRRYVLKLFRREDGEAVDWELIAGSLFRAGFGMLEKLPEDRRRVFAARIHDLSYGLMTGNAEGSGSDKAPAVQRKAEPSHAAAFNGRAPRPPR